MSAFYNPKFFLNATCPDIHLAERSTDGGSREHFQSWCTYKGYSGMLALDPKGICRLPYREMTNGRRLILIEPVTRLINAFEGAWKLEIRHQIGRLIMSQRKTLTSFYELSDN